MFMYLIFIYLNQRQMSNESTLKQNTETKKKQQ